MTTPTQTEYGPEIVVDGVKPGWYRGEQIQWSHISNPVSFWLFEDGECAVTAGEWGAVEWAEVSRIRLPASHAYYITAAYNAKHGTQFKYWPGGDEAPGDWDGGEVLSRERGVHTPTMLNNDRWHWRTDHPFFSECTFKCDIIGYTPKPCATSVHSADATTAKSTVVEPWPADVNDPSKVLPSAQAQPDFVPCERTLRMALGAIPLRLIKGRSKFDDGFDDAVEKIHAALEALLPKKDRAKELVDWFRDQPDQYGVELDRPRLEEYTRRLIAQGEIRG